MDEKRKNEIAYSLLRVIVKKEISFSDIANVKREIGNLSKETSIPKDELLQFKKIILREVFENEMVNLQEVKVETKVS